MAGFFTWVRVILKQEFRRPLEMVMTLFISFGAAIFVGDLMTQWGAKEWIIRSLVAGTALLAPDFIRALLKMGTRVAADDNFLWGLVAWYFHKPEPPPAPAKLPEDHHP